MEFTHEDKLVLSIFTQYLFADNYKEVVDYASESIGKPIDSKSFLDREIQAEVKQKLYDKFNRIREAIRKA